VPRTASGRPDLRGFWTSDNLTPLERPVEFGDRRVLTADEAAAYTERRVAGWVGQPQDNIHYDDVIWQREAYEKESLLRTSLIVEPANGRMPPLTVRASDGSPRWPTPGGERVRPTAPRREAWRSAASAGATSDRRCCRRPTARTSRFSRRTTTS
jgi:hypothetical protein